MNADFTMFSSGQVALELGIPRWRLQYLIERGDLPAPSQLVAGRRLFSNEDVAKLHAALDELEAEQSHDIQEAVA